MQITKYYFSMGWNGQVRSSVVLETPLEGDSGQYLWDTRRVPAGAYSYGVTAGGKRLASGTVVVR